MNESFLPVEQAVIATQLGEETNKVALAQKTPNVSDADLQELLNWARRVELFDGCFDQMNMFFFPIPSGALAIGRLTPDAERPQNSGRCYFQTALLSRDVFYRCGANPPSIYSLAMNTGLFSLYLSNSRLKPFVLRESRSWVEMNETIRTAKRIGVRALSTLTQSVLASARTSFVSEYRALTVVSGLFALLPIRWRPELSFSVGVRFRGDAPLRLSGATVRANDGVSSFARTTTPFFDLRDVGEDDRKYPITNSWAALIEKALRSERVDFIYQNLVEDYYRYRKSGEFDDESETTTDEIEEMGAAWLEELNFLERGGALESDDALSNDDAFFSEYGGDESDSAPWKNPENDFDWGGGADRWRGDECETKNFDDAEPSERSAERRADVDFIFDDEPAPAPFDARDENGRVDEPGKKRASNEVAGGRNAGRAARSSSKSVERRDAPNASRREDLNETLRRLRKMLEPSSTRESTPLGDAPDLEALFRAKKGAGGAARSAIFGDAASIGRRSPFDALREEFPADEAELGECDALIVGACRGDDEDLPGLRALWDSFRRERDEEFVARVGEEYVEFLRDVVARALESDVVDRVRLTARVLDVFNVIGRRDVDFP